MTFLGWLSDPFKGLSDLQLGDQKVTLNNLVAAFPQCFPHFANFPLFTTFQRNDKQKKVAKAPHIEASLFENSKKLMKPFHLQENLNNLSLESA